MDSIDIPDVNVWFALTNNRHVHRERATQYWEGEAASKIVFTSHTMLGLARLLTNAHAMHGAGLSVGDAWATCLRWTAESGVSLTAEPSAHLAALNAYVKTGSVTPSGWSDAYLAACALAGNFRLVSFDSDFHRFRDLEFLHLTT